MDGYFENYVILKKDDKGYYIEWAFKEGAPHVNRCIDWYSSYQENAYIRNGWYKNLSEEKTKLFLEAEKNKIDAKVGKIFRLTSFTCGGEENPKEQIERHKESWLESHSDSEGFVPENYLCKVGCPAKACRELQCKYWTYSEPVKCACWHLEGPIEFKEGTSKILDGKKISREIKEEIYQEVKDEKIPPRLDVILVGNDGGSEVYVRNKEIACKACGFDSEVHRFPESVTEEELLGKIKELNERTDVTGFFVQLPLPDHIDTKKILESIDPEKDVDGFNPYNIGGLWSGLDTFSPATPSGIIELLKRYQIKVSGKHCVIVGRSSIVGKPLAGLLLQNDATVTICHSKTEGLKEITRTADILISSIGKPGYIDGTFVKPGVVVIDVGTTRVPDPTKKSGYRLSGDVNFEKIKNLCSYITPVPGGVGPMTIAMLMLNTLKAYQGK